MRIVDVSSLKPGQTLEQYVLEENKRFWAHTRKHVLFIAALLLATVVPVMNFADLLQWASVPGALLLTLFLTLYVLASLRGERTKFFEEGDVRVSIADTCLKYVYSPCLESLFFCGFISKKGEDCITGEISETVFSLQMYLKLPIEDRHAMPLTLLFTLKSGNCGDPLDLLNLVKQVRLQTKDGVLDPKKLSQAIPQILTAEFTKIPRPDSVSLGMPMSRDEESAHLATIGPLVTRDRRSVHTA